MNRPTESSADFHCSVVIVQSDARRNSFVVAPCIIDQENIFLENNMLAEATNLIESLPNLGVAGLMGAMWLWERRTSTVREKQIEEAHQRIMSDGVKLEALFDLVQKNTEVLSQLVHEADVKSKQ